MYQKFLTTTIVNEDYLNLHNVFISFFVFSSLFCFVFWTVSPTAFACLHGNINKSFITALPLWLKKIYQFRLSLQSSSGTWNICISQKYHAAYKLNEIHHCYCAKQQVVGFFI